MNWRTFIWTLWAAAVTFVNAEKGLEFPVHDGKDRLVNLSKKNFDRFTKRYDILLVYFFSPPSTPGEEKNWELTESMLELAAQITEREGVAFGVVDLSKDKKLASKLGVYEIGSIYCYYRGHKIEFAGQRSTDILVEFILELDEHPVEDINSKIEVTAFKRNDELPRVVAYFDTKKSLAFDEFYDAAIDFQPLIPFYAVFNWQLAKSLGFKDIGEIQFYESFSMFQSSWEGNHLMTILMSKHSFMITKDQLCEN